MTLTGWFAWWSNSNHWLLWYLEAQVLRVFEQIAITVPDVCN